MGLTKVSYAMIDGAPVNVLDYGAVGDGVTNNTTAIQAAVDYASSLGGGTVWFPSGTYMTNEIVVPANVIIDGGGSTIKAITGQYYIFRITGLTNVTIQNFTFDCTGLVDTNPNPIDSGILTAAIYIRVGTGSYSNISVLNNRFINIPTSPQTYHAIGFNGAKCVIQDNYIDQCGGDAINLNGGINIVSNNHILNGGDGAVAFNNGARGIISNNYMYKCDLGVGCGPEGDTADPLSLQSLQISNNYIDSCRDGILLGYFGFSGRTGPENVVISDNVLYNTKEFGIRYDGHASTWHAKMSITGNVIYRTGSDYYDDSFPTSCADIVLANAGTVAISGNICTNPAAEVTTRRGIWIESSARIDCTGNEIDGGSSTYTRCVTITNAINSILNGNILRRSEYGIYLDGSANGNGLLTVNNRIIDFTVKGIYVENVTNELNIKNNYLHSITESIYAIYLPSAIFYTVVNFNTIKVPASTTAIVLNGPGTSDYYDISYNTVFGGTVTDGGPVGATKQVTGNW